LQAARQKLFANQVLKRNPSPLAPATWMQLLEDLPAGWRQVVDTLDEWLRSASGKWPELAGLLGGIALAFLVLTALVRRFLAYRLDGPREEPPGFFMQASAVGWVAPGLAVPSLAVIGMLAIGLDSLDLLTFEVGQIADVAFPALVMFAVVSALARAILSPRRLAWRLVDLSTPAARRLARIITRIAAVFAGDLILQEAIRRLYVPVSISVMETALASIAVAILMLELVRTRFEPKSVTAGVADAGEGAIAGRPAGPVPRFKPYLIKLPLLAVALAIHVLTLTRNVGLGRLI
jgi:small-conductance mechanosensitive channel